MPSTPTREDLERLVSAALSTGEFNEQAEQVGFSPEKFVAKLLPDISGIWEAGSAPSNELQKLQTQFDSEIGNALDRALARRTAWLRDLRLFLYINWPLLVLLYFTLRYSESARTVLDRMSSAPRAVVVGVMFTELLIGLSLVSSYTVLPDGPWKWLQPAIHYFRRLRPGFATIVFLTLLYLASRYFRFAHIDLTRIYNTPLWLVVVIAVVLLVVGTSAYTSAKETGDTPVVIRTKLEQHEPFVSLNDQIAEQQRKIDEAVLSQGIKPRMREILEDLLNLPFSEHLPKLNFSGLAEVFNSANEVATDGKRELEFMLESMPGGSIGIAGPRGSGKSTLLQSACKERPDNLTKRKVIPLFTTSPVEYDGRDFILHLFSSMCDKILDITGEEDRPHVPVEEITESRRYAKYTALRIAQKLALPALASGLALIFLSIFLAFSTMNASPPAMQQAAAQPAATPDGPTASPLPSPAPSPTPANLARFVQALDLKPGTLLTWGVVLTFCFVVIFFIPGNRAIFLGDAFFPARSLKAQTVDRSPESVIEALDLDDKIQEQLKRANRKAHEWLKNIKFQQSYTSGWSGAMKLPIGLEGGTSEAMTLAQHQLSLPDITKGFCDFVSGIARDFTVIIGIDELDKLESDEAAQRFLNEIKAIFGLSKVFYLISVSENAMSNFERRGVPFRDVFDSSFDNIVYVDYLTLEYGKRLIARRVVGMPPPFAHLCYCISGGLARDLVRTCRNLMQYSHKAHATEGGPESNLKALSAKLIQSDLRLKLHALTVVARKLSPGIALDSFLKKLQLLESQLDSAPALISSYTELLKAARPAPEQTSDGGASDLMEVYNRLRQRLAIEKPSVSDSQTLGALHEELATYIYYCVTVLEFFSGVLNAHTMVKAEADKVFDELARARQYLAINASITRAMLDKFRQSFEMPVPAIV